MLNIAFGGKEIANGECYFIINKNVLNLSINSIFHTDNTLIVYKVS